jgi:hypothetical protein
LQNIDIEDIMLRFIEERGTGSDRPRNFFFWSFFVLNIYFFPFSANNLAGGGRIAAGLWNNLRDKWLCPLVQFVCHCSTRRPRKPYHHGGRPARSRRILGIEFGLSSSKENGGRSTRKYVWSCW